MKKLVNILYYIGFIFLAAGVISLITALVFEEIGNEDLSYTFGMISSICGPVCLLIFIVRLVIMVNHSPAYRSRTQSVQKEIKTVDVKEIPKTKEELLFEQYEDLYKRNLITKEDLEKKREELLKK